MSETADICLTEAAHWLAFGQWQHDARTYAAAEAWQVDDPEGELRFGSREAAWYASDAGLRFFQALTVSPDPFGRSLKGSFETAKRMVAFTRLSPLDLHRALQAHYGPRREALMKTRDELDHRGFAHIIRWAGNQEIQVTGVGETGTRRRVAPALFLENFALNPATPQIVVERGGAWQTAKELRVSRQAIEERAAIERLTPEKLIKRMKPGALKEWLEGLSASGLAATRADIRDWAKAHHCPIKPTIKFARKLADELELPILGPGQRKQSFK